jgi:hypothetical protein
MAACRTLWYRCIILEQSLKAGVKRMGRVAARKIGAITSLEYFRPNTTITMAAAVSKWGTTGEPRTVILFMVNFSLY